MDSPLDVEDWLDTLDDTERGCFDKGFATAIEGVLEHMTESKIKILNAVMDMEPSSHRKQLLAKVQVLDLFDKHYRKRLRALA